MPGDRSKPRYRSVHAQPLPYGSFQVAVFADPPPAGPVALYLGKLALSLGDHQPARRRLDRSFVESRAERPDPLTRH
jgi:hypothetical protein